MVSLWGKMTPLRASLGRTELIYTNRMYKKWSASVEVSKNRPR